MVGSLGEIVFEVSEDHIRTFSDFQLQRTAKYTEHSIAGRKGVLEFTGFGASTASLKIRLDAALGVNPHKELETLWKMFNAHEAVPFILNGEIIGDNLWVIESLDESYDIIDNTGLVIALDVSLKLKEYIEIDEESEKVNGY